MDNKEFIKIQRQIIPEIIELMDLRYDLLSFIKGHEPIGRRNLANELSLSERQVRNEIEFFQKQGFVVVERQGIRLTVRGETILKELKGVLYSYKDLEGLVEDLKEYLSIKKIFIVPGDSEKNKTIMEFMGQTVGHYLGNIIKNDSIIAITGGSSLASVGRNLPHMHFPNAKVVPIRGGIGKSHSTQANSIVSTIAEKLEAKGESLYIPDNIDKEILDMLKDSPEIKEVFETYDNIDILIFGIGRADIMAQWRHMSEDKINKLMKQGAIAETFGYFLNNDGKIVCPASSVGLKIEQYEKIPNIIAIAGGREKAKSIAAACKLRKDLVLVTDESAALKILKNRECL